MGVWEVSQEKVTLEFCCLLETSIVLNGASPFFIYWVDLPRVKSHAFHRGM